MGNHTSHERKSSRDERAVSRKIDLDIEQAREAYNRRVKVLILGNEGSGKATIMRQMKSLYGKSADTEMSSTEKVKYVPVIHRNIVDGMKVLISAAKAKALLNDRPAGEVVLSWGDNKALGLYEREILEALWDDAGIIWAWNNRWSWQRLHEKLEIIDSLEYFMRNLRKICTTTETVKTDSSHAVLTLEVSLPKPYVPSHHDIIMSRNPTKGINKALCSFHHGTTVEFYDVAGQRNERRKWMHHFDDVTAILFIASISEFDQVIYEDYIKLNLLDESISSFQNVRANHALRSTSFIVFLNKIDLFREKLRSVPFKDSRNGINSDYTGSVCENLPNHSYRIDGSDNEFEMAYRDSIEYLKRKFLGKSRYESERVYFHETVSIDTQNIEKVLDSCVNIFVSENFKRKNGFKF